jgi:hypothetical protein
MNTLLSSTKNMTPEQIKIIDNVFVAMQKEIIALPVNNRKQVKEVLRQ